MFSPRTPSSKLKAQSFGLGNKSVGKSPITWSGRNKSNLANQSLNATSQMITEPNTSNLVQAFGAPLPVLITEALTTTDRQTTEVSAVIDPSGWAWLVGGRKLFVWRYQAVKGARASRAVVCKELVLPASDLAHSAERVAVLPGASASQPTACIAVSPEGVVRYWPNVASEAQTAEVSAELRGQEAARVLNFQPHGCLLATTTSSLLLLEPTPGQPNVSVRPLNSSQGIFSGISRRMSSFIFGASQIEMNEAPLQAIVASHQDEYDSDDEEMAAMTASQRAFYVLSGNHLSKWQVPLSGPEKILYQVDAGRLLREALAGQVWGASSATLPQLHTRLLDMQLTSEGVVVLGSGVNTESSSTLYYALAYLETENESMVPVIKDLVLLDHTETFSEEEEEALAAYRLLSLPDKHGSVFVYSCSAIMMQREDNTLERMELRTAGDRILGAGSSDGAAVFLSSTHGVFSVAAPPSSHSLLNVSNNQAGVAPSAELTSLMDSLVAGNDSPGAASKDDASIKLKEIFVESVGSYQEQAQTLVDSLLNSLGGQLDATVAAVSRDLMDDFPSADPRWAETGGGGAGATSSVIILQQLRDKEKAHDLYISFLKMYGIWERLGVAAAGGGELPTPLLLCQNVEKLQAALALRELHMDHHKLVDWCIAKVLRQRGARAAAPLTPQDVFYREVTRVQDVLPALLDYQREKLSQDLAVGASVAHITAVNTVLEAMLSRALHYRQTSAASYALADPEAVLPEYIPWTATAEVRKAVSSALSVSLERGVKEAGSTEAQGVLYQQVVGLGDILLDGYASQLATLKPEDTGLAALEERFTRARHSVIQPLMEHGQHDRAAALAEKFEDFEMLMRICDATDSQDRLMKYRTQFASKGFSQFVFNWYMKEGKRGHLLATAPGGAGEELSAFLSGDATKYLSWLHELARCNYAGAHSALSNLAASEKNFLSKKKTLLSLSKLAALASDDTEDSLSENIEAINDELDLVLHQEQLPSTAVENVGMDPDNMRVLTPQELIELYISDKNECANELDIKKSLDLLSYIDKSEQDTLKLHIWCRALLMDSWEEANETDPMESNKDKIFFKTVDLVYMEGQLESMLPELDSLLGCEELGDLKNQPNFKFLLQGGYEQIKSVLCISS